MNKKYIILLMKSGFIALVLLVFTFPAYTQNNTEQLSNPVIDTVDDENDLFDDNTNYKELYKDLNKDGDWMQIKESDLDDDSGDPENVSTEGTNVRIINVWRPRGMSEDWSPYSEGRWVYTYSGWVWATDYDWGWAAYHYGRWVYYDLYGWVWLPGSYWAPSWVQWCYTSDYIGWYPIYPRRHGWHHGHHGWHDRFYHGGRNHHWVIVKRNRFTEKINKEVVVDRNKNAEILKDSKTKAIIKYNGGSLENVGPKVTAIEKNTGQKINPKEINYNGSQGVTKVDNNSVSVYRNDISKKDKINNNGTKINNNNTGTKTKDNTSTRTKDNTSTRTKDNTSTRTKDNTSTRTKDNTSTKSKNGHKNKESSNNNGRTYKESTRNKESNSNRGSTYKESTRNSESNSNRGNKGSNSNRGNNGSNSNRGNKESKSSNRK